jgi:UPF0716 protein FxsA
MQSRVVSSGGLLARAALTATPEILAESRAIGKKHRSDTQGLRRLARFSPRERALAARRRYMASMAKLLLLVPLVLLVDLWILAAIGGVIGFWPTVALVIVTAFLGAALAKWEGRRVLGSWRDALAQGRAPDEGITSGLLVLLGAALLITPGILTDLLGLSLLFPPTRRRIAAAVRARMERRFAAAGGLRGVVAGSDMNEGAPWSVQVVQIGGPLTGAGVAETLDEAARAGWYRGDVIDVEAESVVVVEDDPAARNGGPPRLPPSSLDH